MRMYLEQLLRYCWDAPQLMLICTSSLTALPQLATRLGWQQQLLGKINLEMDSLMTYVERVKLFIQANGIEDARRVPVLLSVIGSKTYDLLYET